MAIFHLISTSIMLNEWVEQTVAEQELEYDLQAAMDMGQEEYNALHENHPTWREQQHNDDDGSDGSPSARDHTHDRNDDHIQKSASLRMRLKMKGKGDTTGMIVIYSVMWYDSHSVPTLFICTLPLTSIDSFFLQGFVLLWLIWYKDDPLTVTPSNPP